jgi:hypothetical protein
MKSECADYPARSPSYDGNPCNVVGRCDDISRHRSRLLANSSAAEQGIIRNCLAKMRSV